MKVCILGNGLSSLTLAMALVNQNIYVDILSQKKDLKLYRSRTLGISKTNIDYINDNIINIEKYLWKLKKIEIYTENLKDEKLLNFTNDNQIFSIIRSQDFYETLNKKLSKNKFFKMKLTGNKDLSFINNYEIIINCDYSHPVTRKYFSKKIVKKYDSFAYTTIIKHKKILNDAAIQIFTRKGPLAFLPLSTKETSIVYSVHNSNNKKKENLEDLIKAYNFKYEIQKIDKIDKFELNSLNLRSYYHKNILAFGDLLHRIHPLAGQGFNMTIRDVKTFIAIIKKRCELGLPLDNTINSEFQNVSKHKNFIFSNGVDLIHDFFNVERVIRSKVLSKSVQFIGKNSSVKKILSKIADEGIFF
jgi:2-octaprenyl-6-methoxyphenol hydroxylase